MGIFNWLTSKGKQPEDFLLMVTIGSIYSWDGRQVKKIGGSGFTHTIIEHDSQIYEGTLGGVKFAPAKNSEYQIVSERESVKALCSDNGTLYDASNGTRQKQHPEVRETFSNKLVASRPSLINTLVTHNGQMYDGGWYGHLRNTYRQTDI